MVLYLSPSWILNPSSSQINLGGGRPLPTHLRDKNWPGIKVEPVNLSTISGAESKYFSFQLIFIFSFKNWDFATNSNFLIHISVQPDGVGYWFFKVRLFDLTEFIIEMFKVYAMGLQRLGIGKSEAIAKTKFLYESIQGMWNLVMSNGFLISFWFRQYPRLLFHEHSL